MVWKYPNRQFRFAAPRKFIMTRRESMGIILATVGAFAASSLWYGPLLFGLQFLELSGVTSGAQPDGVKIAAKMPRNVLPAFAIGQLLALQASNRLRGAIGLAALLWIGFPFMLLSGSVLWQDVPQELGSIHCGDWLIKILLTPLTL
jgi:Protein of unknown function (DUF1761)